jgi:preprotein translocase subunit SecD
MKNRNIMFRLALTLFFFALAIYYLYPTFRFTDLKKQEEKELISLAQLTGSSASDLQRAAAEGRSDYVLDQVSAAQNLTPENRALARGKADLVMGELAEKLEKSQRKALKLGLDLQGGIHLVLEVDLPQLMKQMANNPDPRFDSLMAQISTRLKDPKTDFEQAVTETFEGAGVRLSRYFLETQASNRQVLDYLSEQADDAIARSLEIMRNRIDQFGVAEPTIVRQGARRIIVELPGVQDPMRARALIGKTALLEFKLVIEPVQAQKVLEAIDTELRREGGKLPQDTTLAQTPVSDSLLAQGSPQTDTTIADTGAGVAKDKAIEASKLFNEPGERAALGEDTSLVVAEGLESDHPFYALLRNMGEEIAVIKQNRRAVELILSKPEIRQVIPKDVELLWSNEAITGPDSKEYWNIFLVKSTPEITGKYLTKADVQIGSGSSSPGREGQPIVTLAMNREGGRIFSRVTGANVNRKLAIVLDRHVYMAPVIKVKIPDGRAIIEGTDNMEEARDLAIVLRAGALPAPVQIIEEQTVGPSLGADSVSKGTLAAIVSFLIVTLFMIWYYKMAGAVADLALVLNLGFMVAILAGFQATLTLPGIAGIILTIGMAVDANVLVYERIREELRIGKTVRAAIDAGYTRATVTILDANITTIIAAVVLYQFGTGPIRGFALTLMIGVAVSIYTAIVASRLIFDLYTQKFTPTRLSI